MSSPNVFTLALMRGALFGKNLTFFSESVGDSIVDSRFRGNDNSARIYRTEPKVCFMKAKSADQAFELVQIPNIGKSLARMLNRVGVSRPSQLKGKDGIALYRRLNHVTGKRYDPCVCDTFMAAVHFMQGHKSKPWWHFTAKRKQEL